MISTYQQVCPVIFGNGAVEKLKEEISKLNITKAFCVYDQGVATSGIAARITQIIKDAGVDIFCYDGVLPDAPDAMVQEAGHLARHFGADAVIGIGGGSSLDTAKAISTLVDNPPPLQQYYASQGGKLIVKSPLILIPTAAGTGSEVTVMSVIHDHVSDAKEAIIRPATLAIVDPELTLTVPPQVTAATGLDALSHAIESYTTNCGNPKADVLALEAIRLITANLEKAYADGSVIEYREKLSFASNIAGSCFSDASVHFGHAVAHEFGIRFHLPHGTACALTLPEVITFSASALPEKVINIAKAMCIQLPDHADAETAASLAADRLHEMMRNMNIPSLASMGISRDEAVSCAKNAVEKNWFIVCAPIPVDIPKVEELIGEMYDHYQ